MLDHKIMPQVDGLGPWVWPLADSGAWTGPVSDWQLSHKKIISRIQSKRTVIQAGGNCGLYPTLLTQFFDKVFTCEPDPFNYEFLRKNVEPFAHKVEAARCAFGEQSKTVGTRQLTPENVGMTVIDDEGSGVTMTTIDEQFGTATGIDFIWLDIEGYEYQAISGARNVIKAHLPVIALERPSAATQNLLSDMGYLKYCESMMDVFFIHRKGVQIV